MHLKKKTMLIVLALVILASAVFLLLKFMPSFFQRSGYLSNIDFQSKSAVKNMVTSLTNPELLSKMILNPFRAKE